MNIIDNVTLFIVLYLCERISSFSKKLNKIEKMLEEKNDKLYFNTLTKRLGHCRVDGVNTY